MADFAATSEGTIAFSVHGDGEPLVLLPGFQSDRTGWRAPNDYLALLDGFQVINVDPLGHGKSAMSHDEADYAADRVVAHVVAVLDEVGVDRAHVWGFSRGGLIAALCAEIAPERCRSAVLGASPVGAAFEATMRALAAGEAPLAVGDWATYWDTWPAPLPDFLKQHFERTNDPKALAAALRAMPQWSTARPRFGLTATDAPRLAYFGRGEVWADAQREELASGIGLTVHEGDWPGHAETMLDAEGVVAVVAPFLRSID